MPVFNPGRHLPAALDGIKAQSYTDYEFLAVDDGSRDGSTKLLESFAEAEPRMRLTMRHNLGLIATRNQLLEAARGELIAWMDSDDISLPGRLAQQVSAFDSDPALVCLGTAAQCIDPKGRYLNVERYHTAHADILVDQQKGGGMRFPTTMMRRRVAIEAGGFREPFKIGEDFDLLLRLGELGKLSNLPEVLYLYRQTISSVCAALGPQWITYRDHILALASQRRNGNPDHLQAGGTLAISLPPVASARERAYSAYTRWSRLALANDNWPLAWRYAGAALLMRPLARESWKAAARPGLHLLAAVLRRS